MFADELKLRAQAIRAKKSGCAADPPKATTVRPRRELAYDGDKCKYNITEKRHRFKRMVYVFALFLVVIIFFSSRPRSREIAEIILGVQRSAKVAMGAKLRKNNRIRHADIANTSGASEAGDKKAYSKESELRVTDLIGPTEDELSSKVASLDARVREIKKSLPKGKFMETDSTALLSTQMLQNATRELLANRYGPREPYRVEITLEFQKTRSDFKEKGKNGSILIEMAPSQLVPHSIYTFMEIARHWKGGAFHRIAPHVLQVGSNSPHFSPWPSQKNSFPPLVIPFSGNGKR